MSKIWHGNFNEVDFDVYQIPLLKDNFSYIIAANNIAIVIDPSEGQPILDIINANQLVLEACLITHHHLDHKKGASFLKEKTDCQLIGPKHEELKEIDQDVVDGDELGIGPFTIQVIEAPGHVQDHILYYFPECFLLFTGDALFLSGCGRIFEGNGKQYFHSLQTIKSLPEKTLLFCGHNYIERNVAFAKQVEPQNSAIKLEDRSTFRTLEEEIRCNPFLKVKTPEEFIKLRKQCDEFKFKSL